MDILKDKSYKSYEKISRYSSIPYYYNILDEKYMYATALQLSDTTYYTLHTVKYGDTLDSLAFKYYNNPTYYWIIADFNRIQDPFLTLKEGIILKIPNLSTIAFVTE